MTRLTVPREPHRFNPVVLILGAGTVAMMFMVVTQPNTMHQQGVDVGIVFAAFLAAMLYMAPAIVAFQRMTEYRLLITIVNLLLGWTVLLWLMTLIWAAVAPRATEDRGDDAGRPIYPTERRPF